MDRGERRHHDQRRGGLLHGQEHLVPGRLAECLLDLYRVDPNFLGLWDELPRVSAESTCVNVGTYWIGTRPRMIPPSIGASQPLPSIIRATRPASPPLGATTISIPRFGYWLTTDSSSGTRPRIRFPSGRRVLRFVGPTRI
jgi:hypothetical protein